jgi:hypothetical protein
LRDSPLPRDQAVDHGRWQLGEEISAVGVGIHHLELDGFTDCLGDVGDLLADCERSRAEHRRRCRLACVVEQCLGCDRGDVTLVHW